MLNSRLTPKLITYNFLLFAKTLGKLAVETCVMVLFVSIGMAIIASESFR